MTPEVAAYLAAFHARKRAERCAQALPHDVSGSGGEGAGNKGDPQAAATTATFLDVLGVAWPYLDAASRRAVRGCSRDGRELFDRSLTTVSVSLQGANPSLPGTEALPVGPEELAASLSAALQRGCRHHHIALKLDNSNEAAESREGQMLAVLSALARPSVTCLHLEGYLSLTTAIAGALSPAAYPGLRRLSVQLRRGFHPDEHARGCDAFAYGFLRMLLAVGPRLHSWVLDQQSGEYTLPSVALQALDACSQLQELTLEIGGHEAEEEEDEPRAWQGCASTLIAIAALTTLRSLDLYGGPRNPPAATQEHVSCLQALSALTALTRLRLDLHGCAYDVPRAALAAALRSMPGLQRLELPHMLLQPEHWAGLSGLTHLAVRGLRIPRCDPTPRPSSQRAGPRGALGSGPREPAWLRSVPLPPRLRELVFAVPSSPQELAALRPPACLSRVEVRVEPQGAPTLAFGPGDYGARFKHINRDGRQVTHFRLLPEAPLVMGAAMGFLSGRAVWPEVPSGGRKLCVSHRRREQDFLLPHWGCPEGHGAWLRPVAAAGVRELRLSGVRLQAPAAPGLALVAAMPNLERLELGWDCSLCASELPGLGCAVALEALSFHLCSLDPCSAEAAEDALHSLFVNRAQAAGADGARAARPAAAGSHLGTVPAGSLSVQASKWQPAGYPALEWADSSVEAVRQRLRRDGIPGALEAVGGWRP